MVHLNRNRLSKKQLDLLFDQLNNTLSKFSSEDAGSFLSELLGYEERIMLAKRLAVIILLLEGKSLYRTAMILKISTATAEKVKTKIDCGKYDQIIASIGKNKKEYFSILETLDKILHLGGILPHRNGPDRYRHI